MKRVLFGALFVSLTLVGFGSWGGGAATKGVDNVLLERTVVVAPEGGSAEVKFVAAKGDKIAISLRADKPSVQPYGYLEGSDGGGEYRPSQETSNNAKNESVFIAKKGGRYSLTVFDGANIGGAISVAVVSEK